LGLFCAVEPEKTSDGRGFQAEGAGISFHFVVGHIIGRIAVVEILGEFVQKIDPEPGLAEGGDDLAQGPVPFIGLCRGEEVRVGGVL
jgi:hypothetical protein